MATRIVTTLEIKNITNQLITLYVRPLSGSPFFLPAGGQAQIKGQASFVAEDSRFDRAQVQSLRKKKVIETQTVDRVVTVTDATGS